MRTGGKNDGKMKKIMFDDKYGLTKAVLEGKKTQTRRIVKTSDAYERVNPDFDWSRSDIKEWNNAFTSRVQNMSENEKKLCFDYLINHPKYKVGEIVAVAQSYKDAGIKPEYIVGYENYGTPITAVQSPGWTNKMFVKPELMPHQIRITDVRVERLQDISDEYCLKEGVQYIDDIDLYYCKLNNCKEKVYFRSLREAYAVLIDKVSGKGTWDKNPYVFVYDFELIK